MATRPSAPPPPICPPPARRGLLVTLGIVATLAALGSGGFWTWKRFKPAPAPSRGAVATPAAAGNATPRSAPAERAKTTAGRWATADYCPVTTVAFLGLRDLPGLARRAADTDACKLLLKGFGHQEGGTAPWGPWLGAIGWLSRTAQASTGETALALTEIETSAHYQPIPHLLLMVRPSEPSSDVLAALAEEAFAALAQDAPHLQRRETAYADVPIQCLGDEDVMFVRAVHKNTLLIASDEATLRRALDLANGKGAPLGEQGAFAELCEETGGRDLFVYASATPLWKKLPSQALPPEASGLQDIDAIALGLEVAPPVFVEHLALHTRGPRSGLLEILDQAPLERPVATAVPEGLLSFSRVRLAPGEGWDILLKTLKRIQTPAEHNGLLAGLEAVHRHCGFHLREDFLKSLGDTMTTTLSVGDDPAHPDLVHVWTLTDPAGCLSCVERTLATLEQNNEPRPFRRQWVEGIEVFVVDREGWDRGMPMPYPREVPACAFGVVQGALVIANRPELVARSSRRVKTAEALPPAMNMKVKAALEILPAQAWVVSYTDLAALLDNLGGSLATPPALGMPLPPALANILKSGAPLAPAVMATYSTPRSVILECRAPLPFLTAILSGAAVGASIPLLQDLRTEGGEGFPAATFQASLPPARLAKPLPSKPPPPLDSGKAQEVPELIAVFVGGDDQAAVQTARKLGGLGPQAREAVPALLSGLENKNDRIRQACAEALGGIGPDAKDAVPSLIEMLKDDSEHPWTHEAAAKGLGGIGPASEAATALLLDRLRAQKTPREKVPYASALGGLGRVAFEAEPDLIAGFREAVQLARTETSATFIPQAFASALGGVGGEAASEVLAPYVTDDDLRGNPGSEGVMHGLSRLGPLGVPALIQALTCHAPGKRNLPEHVRQDAATFLAKMGPDAAPAIPALLAEILDDEQGYVFAQGEAVDALRNIGPSAVPALLEARKHLYEVSHATGLSVERTRVLRSINEALAALNATPAE